MMAFPIFSPRITKVCILATAALTMTACGSETRPTQSVSSNAPIAASKVTLNGVGASFPAPLYERYSLEFKKKNPSIQVNYQAIGSGAGVKQTIAGTIDFGGSDAAMTDDEIAQVKRGVILVPTAGGAVSVVYNAKGISNLNLSRSVLPQIFSGEITKWNDPKIAKDNPGVALPDQTIRPVVRADSSGTTFIFTSHLSAVSEPFKSAVGANKAPAWKQGFIKSRGNAGVAASVNKTPGAIGYVEYSYAKENNIPTASVQNLKGEFVSPSIESADKALESASFPSNYRVFVNDPSQGYPIVGLTWMMVYKSYPETKAEPIKKWINWVLTDGQALNQSLSYTRIPSKVAQEVIQTVNSTVK